MPIGGKEEGFLQRMNTLINPFFAPGGQSNLYSAYKFLQVLGGLEALGADTELVTVRLCRIFGNE